jgi:hypothetical protein
MTSIRAKGVLPHFCPSKCNSFPLPQSLNNVSCILGWLEDLIPVLYIYWSGNANNYDSVVAYTKYE